MTQRRVMQKEVMSKERDPRFIGRWAAAGAIRTNGVASLLIRQVNYVDIMRARGNTVLQDPGTGRYRNIRAVRQELTFKIGQEILKRSRT